VATAQARVAVSNIVTPGSAAFDGTLVPSIAFCDPPLASVGLSEAAAHADGMDVVVRFVDTSGWLSSQRVGLRHTGAKTLVDRSSGRVLGAHLLCHNADELINLFALAIDREATVAQLKAILWGYPTASSEIVYLL
jgi:glutathione reductase (NADPH)